MDQEDKKRLDSQTVRLLVAGHRGVVKRAELQAFEHEGSVDPGVVLVWSREATEEVRRVFACTLQDDLAAGVLRDVLRDVVDDSLDAHPGILPRAVALQLADSWLPRCKISSFFSHRARLVRPSTLGLFCCSRWP